MTGDGQGDTGELEAFALELAHAAGEAIMPHFRAAGEVVNKDMGGFDPVTEADRAGERVMRDMITGRYPDHGIRGEEFADREANSPFTWILDPVDGTRSFIFGMPTWACLIGLLHEGVPLIGIMHQPFVGETFTGGPHGAWWLGRDGARRRLQVNPAPGLASALASTTGPFVTYGDPRDAAALAALRQAVRAMRFDGDAYYFCLLAAGQVDIAIDAGLKFHDIAPLVPIIEGAGGVVTTWDGGPASRGGNILAAASADLHAEAAAVLAGCGGV